MAKSKAKNQLDFELKLPKGYLSYSQINLYLNDPAEYHAQYIMGKDFMAEMEKNNPATAEKIKLGSIFQDAWAIPTYNWRKELKAKGFTSDKERIIETALKQPNLARMKPSLCDKGFYVEYLGIKLIIKPDGLDPEARLLLENKFGAPRQQEKVDEDLQLGVYAFGVKLKYGFIPKIILQSVSDTSGRVKQIATLRDEDDMSHVGDLIVQAARGISEGIWEK